MNIEIYYTSLIIIFIIILLYSYKPHLLFKPNGKIRQYGFGYDSDGYKKTLFNLQFIIIILVLLVFLIQR